MFIDVMQMSLEREEEIQIERLDIKDASARAAETEAIKEKFRERQEYIFTEKGIKKLELCKTCKKMKTCNFNTFYGRENCKE
jgi:hypothetical protein